MPSSELSVMFCYVYVLRSTIKEHYYVGFTQDLNKRIAEHNNGSSFSTRPHAPWELIYYEAHLNKEDASRREKCLKTTAGKQALNKMLRKKMMELKT